MSHTAVDRIFCYDKSNLLSPPYLIQQAGDDANILAKRTVDAKNFADKKKGEQREWGEPTKNR